MRIRWFLLIIVLLAVFLDDGTTAQASPTYLDLHQYPVIPAVTGTARYLARLGRQYGNHPNVFSKVGDSITQWGYFLAPVGTGGLRLGDHPELAGVAQWFSQAMARTNNSFANESLAAHGGWRSWDLLDPSRANPGLCQAKTPVGCEMAAVRPSVALIMIGTNDLADGNVNAFRTNLSQIVTIVESYGVIPVLSTIPYRRDSPELQDRTALYNDAILRVALTYNVPLWNYWLAVEPLPSNGVSVDGVHPSVPPDQNTAIFDNMHLLYGFTMRNLTALQVLNRLMPILQ